MEAGRIYDVIVLGYGPVGQALALMLGRQGRSVAVCDRWPERYPLPRAVCIDHEIYRVLAAIGMGSLLPSISHSGPKYQWFNAQWRRVVDDRLVGRIHLGRRGGQLRPSAHARAGDQRYRRNPAQRASLPRLGGGCGRAE